MQADNVYTPGCALNFIDLTGLVRRDWVADRAAADRRLELRRKDKLLSEEQLGRGWIEGAWFVVSEE